MYAQLPQSLKLEVQAHLEDNNFPAAKRLYDEWKSHSQPTIMSNRNLHQSKNQHKDKISA